ncbi:MAG: hypothetical protein KUG69_14265 [Marinosulfonomonas sp.]|nr:hypothetical protein [Marinosulfonomonas sp.]
MIFARLPATALCLCFAFSIPAKAQNVPPDVVRAVRECLGSNCLKIAVKAAEAIYTQPLSAETQNSQLGVLAAVLFEHARSDNSPRAGRDAARAIESLAAYSTDPIQRQSFLQIAKAIRLGIASELDLELPVAASPS